MPTSRDAGHERASLVRVTAAAALALLFLAPTRSVAAQNAPRPWLDWKTTETEHFVLHYPSQYRTWTLALAERIESVRGQVERLVGHGPAARVQIVVDDPANSANGYAFTTLDAPTIVLWPTPPDPRSEIGNYHVWQELLATHEYAHVAHLTRPSRNGFQRFLWNLSPVPLGPITTKSPRWLLEGYATFVEGRVSGTGRPNNAWRAAILRQFALEGRLPPYAQLSATGGWEAGSFAYLAGSAYLEWLARRQGDASIVALWRRMTAVNDRSFESAFTGVYGESPAVLYARFIAELTADAVGLERAMRRDGLVEGSLVQRLARTTGDPAVSPDGQFVALTIRRQDLPSHLVVWRTTPEPDTVPLARVEARRRRDPEDVPDRRVFPRTKTPVISLIASDGAPYETPRWFADNRRLLVTRSMPLGDGALRPDLFIWNAQDGDLRRLTHGAALRDADPAPDGRWAAAIRCAQGWCDLVRVDLETGALRVLRGGSVRRNYYRPRVSPRTGEIVVGEQAGDRWRLLRVSPTDGAARYADPDDGVTRYDATWTPDGRAIVATSEATGIANLERIDSARAVTRLTSVTGAAVAADVAPDGALWFLALHAGGYDVRRLPADSAHVNARLPASLAYADSLEPILPPRVLRIPFDSSARPGRQAVGDERSYAFGPSRVRYLPAASSGYGGNTAQLALVRSDPVGRFGAILQGAIGDAALPAGGALALTLRSSRITASAMGWLSHEAPSRVFASARRFGLDLTRGGGGILLSGDHAGDGGDVTVSLGGLSEHQRATMFESAIRTAGIATLRVTRRQRDDQTRYQETFATMGEVGNALEGRYVRQRSSLTVGSAGRSAGFSTVQLGYGSVGGGNGSAGEAFVFGGLDSPLMDPLFDARRVSAPAYPLGSAMGTTYTTWRVALPVDLVDLFYAGIGTDVFRHPLRSYGAELRQRIGAVPALGTPNVAVLAGVARAVDAPVVGMWRLYLHMAVSP